MFFVDHFKLAEQKKENYVLPIDWVHLFPHEGFLLNQVSKIRLKDSDGGDGGQDIRKNAEAELYKGLQTIRQSNMEIKEILSILKPLLVSYM